MTIVVSTGVASALRDHRPVVALESAVVTAGMPRQVWNASWPSEALDDRWNRDQPTNLEIARAMHRAVESRGGVPAMVAVLGGTLHIGLEDDQLMELAGDDAACKASMTTLAQRITSGATAGTTVSGTLAAIAAHGNQIRTLATGGIGGVHRRWTQDLDISADLRALATVPMCVLCSGAKSILDLPATMLSLEALGVPVVGIGVDRLPAFLSTAHPTSTAIASVRDPGELSDLCTTQWKTLGRTASVLGVQPVPSKWSICPEDVDAIIATHDEATNADDQRTPHLLGALVEATQGRSLDANVALLLNNAQTATDVATAIASQA